MDQYPEHLTFFKSLSLSPEIRIEHAFIKEQLNEYTHIFVDTTALPLQLVLQIDGSRFWTNVDDTAENFLPMLRSLPDLLHASSTSAPDADPSSSAPSSSSVLPSPAPSGGYPPSLQPILREALQTVNALYPGLFSAIDVNLADFRSKVADYKDQVPQIMGEYIQNFAKNFASFLTSHLYDDEIVEIRIQGLKEVFKAHHLESPVLLVLPAAGPPPGHPRVEPTAFKMVAGLAIVSKQMVLFINPKRFWVNVADTAAVRDTDFYFYPQNHIPECVCYCHSGREKGRYIGQSTKGMAAMEESSSHGSSSSFSSTGSPSPSTSQPPKTKPCFKCKGSGMQACVSHSTKVHGCGQCTAGKTYRCSYCTGKGTIPA